ncbi:MAG TPA: DUF3105 domain-containing protein [Polyangiaceae bacterium]
MRFTGLLLTLLPLAAGTGCVVHTEDPPPPPPPSPEERLLRAVDNSKCNAQYNVVETGASNEVPTCRAGLGYDTNPPSWGDYYPTAPPYQTYAEALARGFWVHSLKNGAVVITYSCEENDCEAGVSAADALTKADGYSQDFYCCIPGAGCPSEVSRLILTPDPELEEPWAASAWGHTLTADCFEPEVFAAFIDAWRGYGPTPSCEYGTSDNYTCVAP